MTLIFSFSSGLNNRIDPARESYNPQTGITKLSEAVNVDVDETGRISRMKGYELKQSGDFHSLCPFNCGGYTLAIEDTTLVSLTTAGVKTTVRTGMTPNARVDYVEAHDNLRKQVFYVNGFERGRVYDQTNHSWNVTAYVGKDKTETPKDPPDRAHLICLFNGRIYVAVNNIIYGSDQWDFFKFWMADNGMMFPGRITMMRPVFDGIYVSAGSETVFLSGQDMSPIGEWEPFSYQKKLDSYVVSGSHAEVNAQDLGFEFSGKGYLCYGPEGVFFAGPGGTFLNLTSKTISSRAGDTYLPDGTYGSAIVIDNERFILTVEA